VCLKWRKAKAGKNVYHRDPLRSTEEELREKEVVLFFTRRPYTKCNTTRNSGLQLIYPPKAREKRAAWTEKASAEK